MHPIFENLFVLELANNHWGRLERGLRIVNDFAQVVRFNNVRAAIKLAVPRCATVLFMSSSRAVRKFAMSGKDRASQTCQKPSCEPWWHGLKEAQGCIPMATPFDGKRRWISARNWICPSSRLASSGLNDWFLIEADCSYRAAVSIVSTGGSSLEGSG
jgi:N-acetylneuraminate synthase